LVLIRFAAHPTNVIAMSSEQYQDLYSGLGFLFYSIAASDGRVAPAEEQRLKQLIQDKWLPLENSRDEFGTDAGHYIGISFEYAAAQGVDADLAWERFEETLHAQRHLFTKRVNDLVRETAAAIASAFAGTNKSEHVRLAQLHTLLGE
jgi:hypothetical protein